MSKRQNSTTQIQEGYQAFIHEKNSWHFMTSLLAVMLFLVIASALPLQSDILSSLYPKKASEAAGTVVVAGTRIYVPINFASTDLISQVQYQISVTGGTVIEFNCGSKDWTATSSTTTSCTATNDQQSSSTLVGGVIVEAGTTGSVTVSATGTVTNIDGQQQTGTFGSTSYSIVAANAIVQDSNVVVPISFTSSEPVNAADFTAIVQQGGSLVRLSCGGAGFTDSGISTGTQCVVYNRVQAKTSGIIATALVRASVIGTLKVKGSGTLSTEAGRTPTTYSFAEYTYTVIAAGTTPTVTVTPTLTATPTTRPTNTPVPTVTPTRTPTPTVRPTSTVTPTLTSTPAPSVTTRPTATPTVTPITSVTPTTTPGAHRGDFNSDGKVDVFDIGMFAGHYEEEVTSSSPASVRAMDLKADGLIDVFDLGILTTLYGIVY
ncbi:hypothetical protein HGA91_01970 [candidate division WWE3 bacterium]|nr:hypothetical protein [candidate division WWE3 bacterium]